MALTEYQKEQKEKRRMKTTAPELQKEEFEQKKLKKAEDIKQPKQDLNWYDDKWAFNNGCLYNIIFGGRGNGKTYAWCKRIIEEFFKTGTPSVYVRRYAEEIRPALIADLFNPHLELISELSEGKYNCINYRNKRFWFEFRDEENNRKAMSEPFCFTAAISTAMTNKGPDKGEVKYIIYDEFLSREGYLQNEYIRWNNVISSYIRTRTGTRIIMLGNTVDYNCPYWREYGLYGIGKMKIGDRTIYQYGESGTSLGIEYSRPVTDEKTGKNPVEAYFAFNNPKLKMITDGEWERPDYQQPPFQVTKDDIRFKFYMDYLEDSVVGNIIQKKEYQFLWFYPRNKDKEIKNWNRSIVYQEFPDGNPYHLTNFQNIELLPAALIRKLIDKGQMFFSDAQSAETVRSYCRNCGKSILN